MGFFGLLGKLFGGGGNDNMGEDNGPGNTGGWVMSKPGSYPMTNPNLMYSINRGREEALANQPWRVLGAPQNAGLGINPTVMPPFSGQGDRAVDRPDLGPRATGIAPSSGLSPRPRMPIGRYTARGTSINTRGPRQSSK